MDLRNLIEPHFDLARLAKDLGEIGHFARVWSVRQWTRADMATIWEASKGFRAVTLDDFVPPEIPPLVEIVHDGKNSLPAYSRFQKCFCRPSKPEEEEGDALFGYNYQSFIALTGPGYYVAHPSAEIGEVDIDHALLPSERPDGWPEIVGNNGPLGRFIYDSQIDVMRGLSDHLSIGRGKRKGRWLDNWFVLVRQDLPAEPGEPEPEPS
jgi:hypothetical protein